MKPEFHLVRIFSGGISNWSNDPPDVESLAKIISPAEVELSVYQVRDGEEECHVAAAHQFTTPAKSKNLDAVSLLRLNFTDLSQCGIQIGKFEFGQTGIPKWDARHRILLVDRSHVLDIVSLLVQKNLRGLETVRRIEKKPLERSMLALSRTIGFPQHLKSLVDRWNGGDWPILSEFHIREELAMAHFDDEFIREFAHEFATGNVEADWYKALAGIRERYLREVVPAVLQRLNPFLKKSQTVTAQ